MSAMDDIRAELGLIDATRLCARDCRRELHLLAVALVGRPMIRNQQRDPEYRRAYKSAKARIARTDALVRALDTRREERGMTKAALAKSAGLQPEVVRRLFTMDSPNPTAATLLALAEALDLEVVARPKKRPAPKATKVAAKQRSGKARGVGLVRCWRR